MMTLKEEEKKKPEAFFSDKISVSLDILSHNDILKLTKLFLSESKEINTTKNIFGRVFWAKSKISMQLVLVFRRW